jgi:serine/threonine protein kinase
LEKLKQSKGPVVASQLGQDIKNNETFAQALEHAGGLKKFCLDHGGKIEWIPDTAYSKCGGKVKLINAEEKYNFKSGSKVCIKSKNPILGWGPAHPWSVGTVRSYSENVYAVEFPESSTKINVHETDLVISTGYDDCTKDIVPETLDPAFDKLGFVRNKDGGVFEFTGKHEGHDKALWEVGFVHGRHKLTSTKPYFEVTIRTPDEKISSDLGVGIGLSEDSFFAGSMVGWEIRTVGFHSKDGCLFYVEDSECKGIPFAPTSPAARTIGCGIIFDDVSHKPQTIFFTRNGSTVGRFPLRSTDHEMVFPVVTAASPAVVEVNLSANPPAMAMAPACSLNTCDFEARYTESSKMWKKVTIKGQKNLKGETLVNFHGYTDTQWVPRNRLRKTETPKQIPFSDLEQVFSIAADGDTINIKDCGVHLMRDPIKIRSAVSVVGVHADKRPTIISRGQGPVFDVDIFADTSLETLSLQTSLKNICVKSVGGVKSKACGVFLRKGNLTIKGCEIVSEQGTGLAVGGNGGDAALTGCTIKNCKVAIKAKGPQAKILFDNTNTVEDCSKEITVENGGQIIRIPGEVEAALLPAPAVEDPTVSPVSAETTNFQSNCRDHSLLFVMLYRRLLNGVGRDVLAAVFKGSYKKEKKNEWTESCGASFLNDIDDHAKRQLGKPKVDLIRQGKCEQFDISLLCSLLLNTPGYIKDKPDAKSAVQTLRTERNYYSHSADFQNKQEINEQEFEEKWVSIRSALDVVMDQLLPAEKEAYVNKIADIRLRVSISPAEKEARVCEIMVLDDELALEHEMREDWVRRQELESREIQDEGEEFFNSLDSESWEDKNKAAFVADALMNHHGQMLIGGKKSVSRQMSRQTELPRDVILSNDKRYRLMKQVGKGGMGTVFEARLIVSESDGTKGHKYCEDGHERGRLALKYCQADQSRAAREADILKRLGTLKHDNIVRFIGNTWDLQSSNLVIIMEHINGEPLDEWLEKCYSNGRSGVTLDVTLPIVKQVAEGMAAVHAENIAHRDLKPGNLIFDEVTGKLVIVDFGLSKFHNANSTTTSMKGQLGTFLWMSPEQLRGDITEISFPSDIWSIGIIWHELLTYFTPFEPSSSRPEHRKRASSYAEEATAVTKILEEHEGPRELPMLLSQPEKVPKAVTDTIAKCLNVDKYKRFQHAKDLLNHLTGLFDELKKDDGPQTSGKGKAKPFEEWSVDEVCKLIKSIDGVGYAEAADVVKEMGIDGKYFADMLRNNDEDLTNSRADDGLGFKPLQLKVVKAKIEEIQNAGNSEIHNAFTFSGGKSSFIAERPVYDKADGVFRCALCAETIDAEGFCENPRCNKRWDMADARP